MQPGQHRETARVLLHDSRERFLLLKTHFDPEVGLPPRWITPGGGIDAGESPLEAAVRELREETGLQVAPEALGDQIWQSSGTWLWGDSINFHTHTDYFYQLDITSLPGRKAPIGAGLQDAIAPRAVLPGAGSTGKGSPDDHESTPAGIWRDSSGRFLNRLSAETFQIDTDNWTDDERRDVLEHRWWFIDELMQSDDLFGPQDFLERLRSWLHR